MIFKSHNGIGHTELNCILDEDELNLSNGDADGEGIQAVPNGDIKHKKSKKETEDEYTFHPFSRIFNGKKITSYFWLAVSIIGIFVTVYMVGRLVAKYYRYEITVGVTWNVTNKNPFPSITFCDKFLMMGHYFAYCGVPIGKRHENRSISCPRDNLKTNKEDTPDFDATDNNWGNGIFHVLDCWLWDGRSCNSGRYFKSVERLNHTCFTWNYDGNLHDKFGHAYINIMINETYQNERSFLFGEIHDPATFELGWTRNSFKFKPSKAYDIRIRKNIIKRLPAPYPSKCATTMPHYIFPGAYTRRSCISSVIYLKMVEKCGDIHDYHRLHIPEAILAKHKRNSSIAETLGCIHRFYADKVPEVDIESCPIACEEMNLYASFTAEESKQKNPDNRTVYFFDIQYEDLDYVKVVEEKAKYGLDELIAELGGVMCFMIGASVITLTELSTYVYHQIKRLIIR